MRSIYTYWIYKILFPILFFFSLTLFFTGYYSIKEIYFYRNNSLMNTAQIISSLSRDAILAGDEFELYKSISKIGKTNNLLINVFSSDKRLNIYYPPLNIEAHQKNEKEQIKVDIRGSLGEILGQVVISEKFSSSYEYKFYILLSLLIVFTFYFLFRNMNVIIKDFKKLDHILNCSHIDNSDIKDIFFEEFKSILRKVLKLTNSLVTQEKEQSDKNQKILLGSIAKQVAHDIRSPLSALNMITLMLSEISEEKRTLINSSIQRINDIANDLISTSRNISENFSKISSACKDYFPHLLSPIIEAMVSEKRLQFKYISSIDISYSFTPDYALFSQLNESDLNRVLSNLINNSVEAIGDKSGSVEVSLTSDDHNAIIKISDNGPGIPPHILAKLGVESISYGKENTDSGSGIGVLHAKKTIESMSGKFSISSIIGNGTTVTISLPLSERPVWFLDSLKLKQNSNILICDDDSSIIALWKKRLSDFSTINANYFTNLSALKSFLNNQQNLDFTLLIDYEFSGEEQTGLDFIIENDLASKSILVTSHYDEPDVIQKCIDHNIKQIPKNICALVPIEMASSKESYDAVVLDDDDLQVRSWQFAAIQKGKNILTFSNSDEFLSALSNIDQQTPIFIDSILGGGIKGEDIAKKINALGFKNIYMSSGHDPSYFSNMAFLKGIIGKTPFFPE